MSIKLKFESFDRANPHLFILFKRYAYDAYRSGQKVGAKAIMERIRWYVKIEQGSPEEYKVNNNYVSHYVRKLQNEDPELAKMFNTRRIQE